MPLFAIERTFLTGLAILINDEGAAALEQVNKTNAEVGVTWLHSYVSEDHTRT
jgi:hypothetical protein